MVLVVGLGNPGKKYEKNRHNVGFMVADALRAELSLPDYKEKFGGEWTRGAAGRGGDLVVLKPMTFMNLSGDSAQPCAAFLKVPVSSVLVLHDELDVPFGELRLKQGGGHAGHNGLRSLIERLGSPEFARVRIGISRPPPAFRGEVADYVLADFDSVERVALPDVVGRAVAATRKVIEVGIQAAMNVVNTRGASVRPGSKTPEKGPSEKRSAESPEAFSRKTGA
jgi:peptidyl-tRNA hydrolase, PTH1 family